MKRRYLGLGLLFGALSLVPQMQAQREKEKQLHGEILDAGETEESTANVSFVAKSGPAPEFETMNAHDSHVSNRPSSLVLAGIAAHPQSPTPSSPQPGKKKQRNLITLIIPIVIIVLVVVALTGL